MPTPTTRLVRSWLLAAAVALGSVALGAQGSPPRAQNDPVLEELRTIRQLLEKLVAAPANAPAPDARVVLPFRAADHVMGKPDAPLTLVEFTDLQCPFCRQFHVNTLEQLKHDYIDTGKLRFISRDLPIEQIHPMALPAARVSRCAGAQGRFWEMRRAILLNNSRITADQFVTFARDLGLDMAAFAACTNDVARLDAAIGIDMADARAAGFNGTPSFVLGRTSRGDMEGIRIIGAQPFATFDAKLKELLDSPAGR